jgi:hypothetical protein
MDQAIITKYIADTFDGVNVVVGSREAGSPEMAWGDTFFIYDPDRNLKPEHQFPFATIVTKDYGEFDCASKLDRPGVFRLNVGISKSTFHSLFPAGDNSHDFTALDRIMPHPVYGKMHWVCVLNPSEKIFEAVKPLLADAHGMSVARRGKPRSEG